MLLPGYYKKMGLVKLTGPELPAQAGNTVLRLRCPHLFLIAAKVRLFPE